jgi:hypothetical protein
MAHRVVPAPRFGGARAPRFLPPGNQARGQHGPGADQSEARKTRGNPGAETINKELCGYGAMWTPRAVTGHKCAALRWYVYRRQREQSEYD